MLVTARATERASRKSYCKAGDGEQVKRAVAECVADVSSFYRKRGSLGACTRKFYKLRLQRLRYSLVILQVLLNQDTGKI